MVRLSSRESSARRKPFGAGAPLWLNLLWIMAFALTVAIGVRVAQTGWRVGLLEVLFVVVAIGALAGSLVAARGEAPPPAGRRRRRRD